MADLTPLVRQYFSIKENHQDAILFFRLGDFYEMFADDAKTASRELDLVLTGRGEGANRLPMCGIPYHAATNYIAKLIDKGYKVAICEQVEDPKLAKGLVKREVIKVITPGTVIDEKLLSGRSSSYLAAVTKEKKVYGLAYVDASTGEFRVTEIPTEDKLIDELGRIDPAELLVSDLLADFSQVPSAPFHDTFDFDVATAKLKQFFKIKSLGSFGLEGLTAGLGAAAAIIDYLERTQKASLAHINNIKLYQPDDFMFLDAATQRNLELVRTIRDKSFQGSLLWVLDRTKTAMGSRLLRRAVLQPLLDEKIINQRLDAVEELTKDGVLRAELGAQLGELADIERIAGRIASNNANAKDLVGLKLSLQKLPVIRYLLKEPRGLLAGSEQQIIDLIAKAIVDEPPFALQEGGLIKAGYNPELDEVKKIARGGKEWVATLEDQERKRSGIKSLKVGYTKVFGYFIEVTNANLEQVPADYIRKQTLVNGERFITPELKEQEAKILNADERLKELEYKLFCEVRSEVAKETRRLQELAGKLAELDMFLALAEVAVANRYCRPRISGYPDIRISGGRHPVVEKTIGEHQFVPNDTELNEQNFFLLITGPNMAGKSTYMRQVALISIMAQLGSFVPAASAELCLIDRIFTRIGAMDDIFSGQSTFMMEMTETANILHNATERSLIILDEIGRGTATFDGMSIAAAVAEFIHTKIKAKTLFATHYHEITRLAEKNPGMKNLNVLVKESGDQITFLHKIVDGPADRSYGIQVAQLAGLPSSVVERAKEVYNTLEMVEKEII